MTFFAALPTGDDCAGELKNFRCNFNLRSTGILSEKSAVNPSVHFLTNYNHTEGIVYE